MSGKLSTEICLSAKGLANLPRNGYENDFTFHVGSERYRCPSFLAAFLSPRIAALQTNDPTVRDFVVDAKDPNHFFTQFLSLGEGLSLEITSTHSDFFRSICLELHHFELYDYIFKCTESEITLDNVFDQ
jgi:hypothetical protein